jgi:anti-sigma B factor antagonist
MSEIKKFEHFNLSCNEITILRFTSTKLSGDGVVAEFQDQLVGHIESTPPAKFVVDFSGVTYCPSLLINCMLRVKKALAPTQGVMKLCCMDPDVLLGFQMLHLDKGVFEILETLDEAIAAFE